LKKSQIFHSIAYKNLLNSNMCNDQGLTMDHPTLILWLMIMVMGLRFKINP